jgi:hypothetical protein
MPLSLLRQRVQTELHSAVEPLADVISRPDVLHAGSQLAQASSVLDHCMIVHVPDPRLDPLSKVSPQRSYLAP